MSYTRKKTKQRVKKNGRGGRKSLKHKAQAALKILVSCGVLTAAAAAALSTKAGTEPVHVAFNEESAQRKYSDWISQILHFSKFNVRAEPAPPTGRVKFLLYVVFLSTPRMDGRCTNLAQWGTRADKIVVVTLRLGVTAQPLQTDQTSVLSSTPQADAIVEFLFRDNTLYNKDKRKMNENSIKRLRTILRHAGYS